MPSLNLPDQPVAAPSRNGTAKEHEYLNFLRSLQDQLLLWMRDVSWRRVADAVDWLVPRMKAELSVDRYLAAGGVRDRKLEYQFGEGKKLVIADVFDGLRRRKLAAFRDGQDGKREICATPLTDPRVELDLEFENVIPRAPGVVKRLEESLLVEEVHEPLVVWKGHGLLVDGYVCYHLHALLGRTHAVLEMDFPDRAAVVTWLYATHYGRGYTDRMKSYVHGKEHLSLKQKRGGAKGKAQRQDVAQIVAKNYGISRNTVFRDAAFAKAIDRIAALAGDAVRQQVLSSEMKWTKGDVRRLAKLDDAKLIELVHAARESGKRPKLPSKKAAILISPQFPKLGHQKQFDLLQATLDQESLDQLLIRLLAGDEIRQQVLSRVLKWTMEDVLCLARLDDAKLAEVVRDAVQSGKRPKIPGKKVVKTIEFPIGRPDEQLEVIKKILTEREQVELLACWLEWPVGKVERILGKELTAP